MLSSAWTKERNQKIGFHVILFLANFFFFSYFIKQLIKENLNFASKSAGVAARVAQSNPILDPAMVARFKKIAGI